MAYYTIPSVTVGGAFGRAMSLLAPNAFDPTISYPFVYADHSYGASGADVVPRLTLDEIRNMDDGYLIAAPDGVNDGVTSNKWFNYYSTAAGEFAYQRSLLQDAIANGWKIDFNRIFGLGYSNGGYMIRQLSLLYPELFTALITLSGGSSGVNDPVSVAVRKIPAVHIHGDGDTTVLYAGDAAAATLPGSMTGHGGIGSVGYKSAAQTAVDLALRNGLPGTFAAPYDTINLVTAVAGAETTRAIADGSTPSTQVEKWIMVGVNHSVSFSANVGRDYILPWLNAHHWSAPTVAAQLPAPNSACALLRFDEPKDEIPPSESLGSLGDLSVDTGLTTPPVTSAFCGFGRAFSNGRAFTAVDLVPGATLCTRDVTIQAILSWDLAAQAALGTPGTIVARGRGAPTPATELMAYALELRVVNQAQQIGELRLVWQDTAGSVRVQQGGQFLLPPAGSFMMLTAVRRWVDATRVEVRYYAGATLIGEFSSTDGDIAGGTTGTFCVGARYPAGVASSFFCGTIDELRVLNYDMSGEEIAATWSRIATLQPRAYAAVKQLLQPGAPISNDPASRIQKLLRIGGHALGFAAAQAENMRQNLLPDRAYGDTLEQWERVTGEARLVTDSIDRRRKRVVSHLRQRAGVSIPGVAATTADLLAIGKSQVQVLAFSNSVTVDWTQGIKPTQFLANPTAQWSILGSNLRVQAGAAANIKFDGTNQDWYTCLAAALGSRVAPDGRPIQTHNPLQNIDGREVRMIGKIKPNTLPTDGEVGIVFFDTTVGNALLFGLRNNAGVYQIITERFVNWVSQGVTVQATSALVPHWFHLAQLPLAPGFSPSSNRNYTASWSTTSSTSGYTTSAPIAHPGPFGWMGFYARSITVLGGALDVELGDTSMRWPYGHRPLRFYVLRDPTLPGTPDLVGAELAVARLQQAHTRGHVITTKVALCDTAGSGCDRTPMGGF